MPALHAWARKRPARAAASRCFGDGRLHPHRHISELYYLLLGSHLTLPIFVCNHPVWTVHLTGGVCQGLVVSSVWSLEIPDWGLRGRWLPTGNGIASRPRASTVAARLDLSGLTPAGP